MEDITVYMETNAMMCTKNARRLRNIRLCQSLGNVPERGARLVEQATGQHEEDKEQEKETGTQKVVRKEKRNQERYHRRQRLPIEQTGTHFAS